MKLLYRTSCLRELSSENPIDYGFDTVQVGFDYSNSDQSDDHKFIKSKNHILQAMKVLK